MSRVRWPLPQPRAAAATPSRIVIPPAAAAPSTNAAADVAAAAGAAFDASVRIEVTGDVATAAGAGFDGTPATSAAPDVAAGTGSAFDAAVSAVSAGTATAGVAAGAAASFDASASVQVTAAAANAGAAASANGTLRGVNSSGGEFGALPGVYDTDFHYDSLASLQYLYGRGHRTVRLPFLWERIQPTLGAALDPTELGRIQSFVADAGTAGLGVVLDVHNYGAFNGVKIGAGGGPTQAQFVDLWTRLSTVFKTDIRVAAYGLMNEPNGLGSAPTGNLADTTYSTWVTDDSGCTVAGTTFGADNVLKMTRSNANSFLNASSPLFDVTVGTTYTLSADFYPASRVGRIRIRIEWQTSGGSPISTQFSTQPTGSVATWTNLSFTATAPATAAKAKLTVYVDDTTTIGDFAYVRNAYAGVPTPVWHTVSQAAVTGIRGNGDTKAILVAGDSWSGVADWAANNPTGWVTDTAGNFLYEGHHYFDRDHSGTYANTYSAEVTDAAAVGWTAGAYPDALMNRVLTELANWRVWLASNGARGLVGEIGWPRNNGTHTGDYASWNILGAAWYAAADAYGLGVTYWSTSEWWGTYSQSLYDSTAGVLAVPNTQAATVEAHPQTAAGPTVVVAFTAGAAAATAAAPDASTAVQVLADVTAGAAAGLDASTAVQVLAGVASATGAGFDAAVSTVPAVAANADVAAGTDAGFDAAAALAVTGDVALGVGSAVAPSVALAVTGDVASATGTGFDAAPALGVTGDVASGVGTAYDATAATSSAGTASAGVASATGAAFDATAGAAVTGGPATGTGTALDAAAGLGATADQATGAGTSLPPAVAVAVTADQATATGTAWDATASVPGATSANADVATGAGTAYDSPAAAMVLAGFAAGTGAAFDALTALAAAVPAGVAAGAASAFDGSATVPYVRAGDLMTAARLVAALTVTIAPRGGVTTAARPVPAMTITKGG